MKSISHKVPEVSNEYGKDIEVKLRKYWEFCEKISGKKIENLQVVWERYRCLRGRI